MNYYESNAILKVFEILNFSNFPYLLLRNTEEELPDKLVKGKDIDILIQHHDREKLLKALRKHKFYQIKHPLRSDVKLYGVHQFDMFESPEQPLLDVNYEIAVRSLDQGQWIPLDQEIQTSSWANAQIVDIGGSSVPMLSNEDLWVCTLARCLFDKKQFSVWHQQMLSALLPSVDSVDLKKKLQLIFFKYTTRLLALARNGDYQLIYNDYMSFKEY
jgi:hypothetical protein